MIINQVNQKLFNHNSIEDPFYYGFIDNFFSRDSYEQLSSSFPSLQKFGDQKKGGKLVFKAGGDYDDFLKNNLVWKNVISYLSSDSYIKNLHNIFSEKIKKFRPDLINSPWTKTQTLDNILLKNTVISFEFSLQPFNSYLEPHTDNYEKLISFVFYFPPLSWQSEYGGGTTFYKPKIQLLNNNLFNFSMPFSLMNRMKTVEYKANRCIYFVKAANSWHSVEKIKAPEGIMRRAFMMNVELPYRIYPNAIDKLKFKTIRNLAKILN